MAQDFNTDGERTLDVRRRVLVAFAVLVAGFLVVFALTVPWLSTILVAPEDRIGEASWGVALASAALLGADVVLPVPSSAVMIANGAAFGFLGGLAISVTGSVAGSVLALLVGRRAGPMTTRWRQAPRSDEIELVLGRWRTPVVIMSRPVPLVAEGVAVLTGATSYSVTRMAAASAAGILPFASLYAWAGTSARGSAPVVLVFGALLASLLFGLGVVAVGRCRTVEY